jgi:hypothetical protein
MLVQILFVGVLAAGLDFAAAEKLAREQESKLLQPQATKYDLALYDVINKAFDACAAWQPALGAASFKLVIASDADGKVLRVWDSAGSDLSKCVAAQVGASKMAASPLDPTYRLYEHQETVE